MNESKKEKLETKLLAKIYFAQENIDQVNCTWISIRNTYGTR